MHVRSPFGHAQATSSHASVHAYSLRAGLRLFAAIGAAPLRARRGRSWKSRSGKHSSRQTCRESYQKYAYHLVLPLFQELSAREAYDMKRTVGLPQLRTIIWRPFVGAAVLTQSEPARKHTSARRKPRVPRLCRSGISSNDCLRCELGHSGDDVFAKLPHASGVHRSWLYPMSSLRRR